MVVWDAIVSSATLIILGITVIMLKFVAREIPLLRRQVRELQRGMTARQGSIQKTYASGPVFRKEPARTTQRSVRSSRAGRMGSLVPLQGGDHGNAHDGELPQHP